MPKTIMVTGSSGTIGTAFVKELIRLKFKVIPLDIKQNLWDKAIDKKTVRHDLRKPLDKLRLSKIPDMIFHLGAHARVHDLVIKPSMALDNYIMTHNVLEYARLKGIKHVMYASSREVYGEAGGRRLRKESDTDVVNIKSPYTASKFAGEALVHSYRECYDMEPVIVRFSNVYGAYDMSERVIPLFIYYALRDRHITVFGKDKKLDFTYVSDAVNGLVAIARRFNKVGGKTFNISSGHGERLYDLAKWIISETNSKSTLSSIDKRVGEISSFVADLSEAKKHLNYNPKIRLAEGLPKNIKWYCDVTKSRRILEFQRRNLAKRGWA